MSTQEHSAKDLELPTNDNSNPQQGNQRMPNFATKTTENARSDNLSTTDGAKPTSGKKPSRKEMKLVKIPPTKKDERKLFVGGIAGNVTDDDFREYFEQFGVVIDSVVMFDKETHRSRGFGFVTFEELSVAQSVLDTSKNKNRPICIKGKVCEVKPAEPKSTIQSGRAAVPHQKGARVMEMNMEGRGQRSVFHQKNMSAGGILVESDNLRPSGIGHGGYMGQYVSKSNTMWTEDGSGFGHVGHQPVFMGSQMYNGMRVDQMEFQQPSGAWPVGGDGMVFYPPYMGYIPYPMVEQNMHNHAFDDAGNERPQNMFTPPTDGGVAPHAYHHGAMYAGVVPTPMMPLVPPIPPTQGAPMQPVLPPQHPPWLMPVQPQSDKASETSDDQ